MARGSNKREGRVARSERPGYGEDALRDARAMGYPSIQAMYDDMPEGPTQEEQDEQDKAYAKYKEEMKEYEAKAEAFDKDVAVKYEKQAKEEYKALSKEEKKDSDDLLDAMKKALPFAKTQYQNGELAGFVRTNAIGVQSAISRFIENMPSEKRVKMLEGIVANATSEVKNFGRNVKGLEMPKFIKSALDRYVDEMRKDAKSNPILTGQTGRLGGDSAYLRFGIRVPLVSNLSKYDKEYSPLGDSFDSKLNLLHTDNFGGDYMYSLDYNRYKKEDFPFAPRG